MSLKKLLAGWLLLAGMVGYALLLSGVEASRWLRRTVGDRTRTRTVEP